VEHGVHIVRALGEDERREQRVRVEKGGGAKDSGDC